MKCMMSVDGKHIRRWLEMWKLKPKRNQNQTQNQTNYRNLRNDI